MFYRIHMIQVAGTSGKALLEGGSDDEGASTEAHGRAIIEVLGRDKRNEVLAALYMVRSDVSLSVRQVMVIVSFLFDIDEFNLHNYVVCELSGTEVPSPLWSGCITCVENYSCKHSKDSEGNNAYFDEYSNFFSCILIIGKAAGWYLYLY